jgi:RimJ/RimL family protein N-acetyltransferase
MSATLPQSLETDAGNFALRPMTADDADAVLAFAQALPKHDLLFLPRDITQPKVMAAWVRAIERGVTTTLLAWDGEAVIGCAAIFRDPHSWSPHVGELRVVTSRATRGRGVGRAMIQACFAIMLQTGIEKITAQMTLDQEGAIAVFESLGFRSEGVLHEQVQDQDGRRHDIVILSHDVTKVLSQMNAYGLARAF